MIQLVIFDFDGLLVDSEPIYVSSNKRFLSEKGINDFTILNKLFGMRAEEAFGLIKETFNFEDSIEEMMTKRNQYIIDDFENGKLQLMPAMFETLEILSKKFKLAIGSSSKKVLLDKALDIYNFAHYFDTIVCGDDVTKGKPEPDIYLKVAERMNVPTENCVVLEDAPNGILAGQRAGMMTIAIPNEQTNGLNFHSPSFFAQSLAEVPSILGVI